MNTNHPAVRREMNLTHELVRALADNDHEWALLIAKVLKHEYRDWNPPPLAQGWRLGE